jgi:hypothetical protein
LSEAGFIEKEDIFAQKRDEYKQLLEAGKECIATRPLMQTLKEAPNRLYEIFENRMSLFQEVYKDEILAWVNAKKLGGIAHIFERDNVKDLVQMVLSERAMAYMPFFLSVPGTGQSTFLGRMGAWAIKHTESLQNDLNEATSVRDLGGVMIEIFSGLLSSLLKPVTDINEAKRSINIEFLLFKEKIKNILVGILHINSLTVDSL